MFRLMEQSSKFRCGRQNMAPRVAFNCVKDANEPVTGEGGHEESRIFGRNSRVVAGDGDRLDRLCASGPGAGSGCHRRSRTHGEAAEKMLRDMGAQAKYVPVDIAQEDDVRKLVDMAIAEFGSLSMLVNNAGPSGETFGYGALHELPGAILEQTIRLADFGAFWA